MYNDFIKTLREKTKEYSVLDYSAIEANLEGDLTQNINILGVSEPIFRIIYHVNSGIYTVSDNYLRERIGVYTSKEQSKVIKHILEVLVEVETVRNLIKEFTELYNNGEY